MDSKAKSEVRKLMAEATNNHNDGYVMAGYKKELKRIYELIENFLFKDARDLDANSDELNLSDDWIYESPDGEKIYRRKSGAPHNTRELIKG